MLNATNISYKAGQQYLLAPTTLQFEEGLFHVIMGANGAGKSTLLKLLAGDQPSFSGKIYLEGKQLEHYSKIELAKKRAVLSQHYQVTFPINAEDMVLMGRYPYFGNIPSRFDKDICLESMRMMNVQHLAHRDYQTLSGGEAQKVQMSRVMAQIWEQENGEKKLLFLDEPVSHLDIKYQYQLLQAAKEKCHQQTTVIAILHDLNLSLRFADRIIFMKEAKIIYDIVPEKITREIIRDVFDVDAAILDRSTDRPVVIF